MGTRSARVLPWLPLVLLLGIAASHFVLVRRCGLHPWLGGGFGMFSTVDTRRIQAWRVGPGGEERLDLPQTLGDAAKRAEALPTEGRLAALARDLLETSSGGSAIRVEVWETRFDPEMRPEATQLRSVMVRGGSVR
jgi:hypothetical protein